MKRRSSSRSIVLAGALAVVLSGAFAVAQWAVDTRVDKRTSTGNADRRVDYRVDNQIYGNSSASVRYGRPYSSRPYSSQPQIKPAASSNALPSEVRYARYMSGALPSEIRGNYAAMGPMPGYGAMPYIPPQRNTYERSTVSQAPIDYRVNTQAMSGGTSRSQSVQPSPLRVDARVSSPSLPAAVPVGSGAIHNNPMVASLPTNTDYAFAPLGSSGSSTGQRPSVTVPVPEPTHPTWDDTLNKNAPAAGSIRYGTSQ